MTETPIAAVAYLRVSTQEQVENGLGLETQRDKISAWAAAQGRVIVAWHVDAGKSGSNGIETRDALGDALDDLGDGGNVARAHELIVLNLTRLARDLVLQELLLAQVRKLGGAIRSTDDTEDRVLQGDDDDDDGHSRKLVRSILGAISEYERAAIKLRLRRGRRRKMAVNGYGGGVLGWGVLVDSRGYLVPDPACAEAVALIRKMRGQGKPYAAIADALNEAGLPSPGGRRPGDGVVVAGDLWHSTGVRRAWLRIERVGQAA